jgi:peroxiredoxin
VPALRAVIVGLAFACCSGVATGLEIGDPAPPFVNLDLAGNRVWSRDTVGRKWVVLQFFATDCEGCRKEILLFKDRVRERPDDAVAIIVMATDPQGAAVVAPYFAGGVGGLTILLDHYRVATERYGVGELPTVFVVDPGGRIAFIAVGYQDDLVERIRSVIGQATR